jgi:NAD(P)-dependent dehydrogenase (short-subunit alcohol dehydrogenase family)
MTKAVLITGCEGGIGRALVQRFTEERYRTIGLDLFKTEEPGHDEIRWDLNNLTTESAIGALGKQIKIALAQDELIGVINNAATQILMPFEELTVEQFSISLQVNCTAAFAVSKSVFPALRDSKGTLLNIGSIHARLTKPKFIAYATSKAALEGMTRAMAVELGAEIKVCAISPAAVGTEMLRAGFVGMEDDLKRLENFHPTRSIGHVQEIAQIALMLVGGDTPFTNGTVLSIDGGIGSVLHDPS